MTAVRLSLPLAAAALALGAANAASAQGVPKPGMVVTTPAPIYQPRGDFQTVMLNEHNAARAAFGVAPLRYDAALAADARVYAEELARKNRFRHSTEKQRRGVQGENLWMGSRGAFQYRTMVRDWVEERRWFRPGTFPNVTTTGKWADVGHYTAIVWPATTAVGCAMASNRRNDFLVCRYTPAGNVRGKALVPAR